MFKDSKVTQLTAWTVLEESEGMPAVNYPALIGTGRLGIGLDCAGLQSLPDTLGPYLGCTAAPYHVTQADLYILHEGMISEHLYRDEAMYTGKEIPEGDSCYGMHRNFMPLGYLTQSFAYDGKQVDGDAVLAAGFGWRRAWDLRHAILTNTFQLERRITVETEIFAPQGSETVYLKLTRHAVPGAAGAFRWSVRLPLETRHGLRLFAAEKISTGTNTILATIEQASLYQPSEDYAVLYGIAADGAGVEISADGWTVTLSGALNEESIAYLRLDFRRFAGLDAAADAAQQRDALEAGLAGFSAGAYAQAHAQHYQDYERFWDNTADIEVTNPDAFEVKRRFLLHMSEYLFHCGNDLSFGGTAQFLLFHQNGWGASNFHDQHYITDGVARANMWAQAEGNARWMRSVMHPVGRAFPWMMTYDGFATTPAARDRAPMSDANRALLAARIYEMAGRGRGILLRDTVYPIIKRVADMSVEDWFFEENGRLLFRGVEADVMGDEATISDAATVLMFLSVLRKALAYSERLGVDAERRPVWQSVLDKVNIDVAAERYVPHLNAPIDAKAGCWLCNIYYIAEAQPFLDDRVYANTCDYGQPAVVCNLPWIGFAAASSEMRLGRPNRAEQFFVDTIEHRTHGPGYFEECAPVGTYGLPPLGTGHGAHLTAACEQVVRPDFWQHRVFIGTGLPAKLRSGLLHFRNIRGRDGLIISGDSSPKQLNVQLHHTGDPVEMEIILSLPCEIGTFFRVTQDGRDIGYDFHGETVTVRLPLEFDQHTELEIR